MSKVKWVIETGEFLAKDSELMIEAFEELEIDYKEIDRNFALKKEIHDLYNPEECVVFFGSLQSATLIRRKAQWVPGVYYNIKAYNCTHYYPAIGSLLLNRDYVIFPYGELMRQKEFLYETLGEDRSIFIRPDRGDKTFTGDLVYKEHYDKKVQNFGFGQIDPHELIIVAKPINLKKEWRFVCVNGEIVDGSSYRMNNLVGYEAGYTEEALACAQKAAALYKPDFAWVIDIGQTKTDRYAVVEIGCFSCAGLYKCNRKKIIDAVSKIALEEWESYQE